MKNGLINLGIFHLNKTGTLNINGMIIKGDETLDSNTKSYLEKYGKIVQNDESITFFGVFQVNITEAKLALPHRFGKYEKTTSGYEYIPGNWFSSMKFDVFSKAVISRDFLQETTCNQIATELKPARDHVLLNYIANALMTKDFNKVNNKFTPQEQSDEIILELDLMIENLKKNITAATNPSSFVPLLRARSKPETPPQSPKTKAINKIPRATATVKNFSPLPSPAST